RGRPQDRHAMPRCFSRDGAALVTMTMDPLMELVVWDAATGRERRRLGSVQQNRCAAFTPDGTTLVAGSGEGTLTLWDVGSGRLRPVSADPPGEVSDLRFDDGGRRLIGRADRIMAWDPATGRLAERFPVVPAWQGHVAISPDRRLLA